MGVQLSLAILIFIPRTPYNQSIQTTKLDRCLSLSFQNNNDMPNYQATDIRVVTGQDQNTENLFFSPYWAWYRWLLASYIVFLSPIQAQDEGRNRVRESLTPSTAQMALQRILPFPCRKQYTVVILMPQLSCLRLLKSFLQSTSNKYGHNPKVRLTHQIHLVCQFFYFWCGSQIIRSLVLFSSWEWDIQLSSSEVEGHFPL